MAKRTGSRRRRKTSIARRMGDALGSISWRRVARGVFNLAMLGGIAVGAVYGLPALERIVTALPEYQGGLAIELVDLPEWLQANSHITRQIAERSGLGPDDGRLTANLVQRVAETVPRIGWIKQVHEVSIGADDVLRIRADFRRPVAWVRHGSYYHLVDEERVRLPGRYLRTEVSRDSGLLTVTGVSESPPPEGRQWEGADLAAALELIAMLQDKPYISQLTSVMVDNYGGRRDGRWPHIQLTTDRGSHIRWGRAPGEEIDEPSASQKLAHLQGIWREYDRIDMGRSWVDIQVWPDRVIVPVSAWQGEARQRS